jgi:hypothetical protein
MKLSHCVTVFQAEAECHNFYGSEEIAVLSEKRARSDRKASLGVSAMILLEIWFLLESLDSDHLFLC